MTKEEYERDKAFYMKIKDPEWRESMLRALEVERKHSIVQLVERKRSERLR